MSGAAVQMIDIDEIKGLIPHRPPFLFVDEIEIDGDLFKGRRTFKEDEPFFAGHFPGMPVVPGVVLIEAMAQCGGAALVKKLNVSAKDGFFLASIKEAKFKRMVKPGDTLEMEVSNVRIIANQFIIQRGSGSVNGEPAVEATWVCGLPKAAKKNPDGSYTVD